MGLITTAKHPARNQADSGVSFSLTLRNTWTPHRRQVSQHHASSVAQGYRLRPLGTGRPRSGLPRLRPQDARLRPPLPPLLHAGWASRAGLQARPLPRPALPRARQDQEPRDRTDPRLARLGHRLGRLLLDRASPILAPLVDPPDP